MKPLSKRQLLDIEQNPNKVDWLCISKYQKLSDQFIEKHADNVDWYYISKYQKLSDQFIISMYHNVPKKQRKQYLINHFKKERKETTLEEILNWTEVNINDPRNNEYCRQDCQSLIVLLKELQAYHAITKKGKVKW